jgi:drug/metabolite transporter (DMT)-like permease
VATSRAGLGYTMLVITMLGWSGAWITAKAAAHDAPPSEVALGRFVVASLGLVPAWMLLERSRHVALGRREWLLVLGMAATGIATYTILFLVGVQLAPASDGAIITPGLSGMFATLVAFLALGERLTPAQLAGGALVLAAVVLLQLPARRPAPRLAEAPA